MDQDAFHQMWGTGGIAPAAPTPEDNGTRVLDNKSFEREWLTPKTTGPVQENTDTYTSAANAATGGAIEGIPILGPYIKAGTEKTAAKIRSIAHGTPYADELKAVQNYAAQSAAAHPTANTIGQVGGAVGPMLLGAGLAPGAFGIAGPLAQRVVAGAGTNALINGADSAVRSGDPHEALTGATVGGVIGGGLPVVGKGLGLAGRAILSPPADAATNALVQKAAALGIPLRPAQISTSPFVNKMDQMVAKIPGSGMGPMIEGQTAGFNRAVAKTFGENADHITPDVMAAAKKRIGSEFDTVAANTTIHFDHALANDLTKTIHEASSVLSPDQVSPLVKQVTDIAGLSKNGALSGEAYQNALKKGAPLDRLLHDVDPNKRFYAGQIREALNDAMARSASPVMAKRLATARLQYKNMKTVEDLAEKAPTGNVSPLLLNNAVRKSYPNFAYGGGGDIADIARIGQRFMRQPPDSGTPLGNKVLDLFMKGGGTLAGGALGGGAYAAYHGENPASELGIGLAGLLAAAGGARGAAALLNRPATTNALFQRLPAGLPAYNHLNQQQQ